MVERRSFSNSKLKGRIVEICGNQEEFAKRLGKDRSLINLKINGNRDFTQTDISEIIKILSIPDSEIKAYFFTL